MSDNSAGHDAGREKQQSLSSYEVIRLPGNDFVVAAWKARSGSAVRKGETVALVVRRDIEKDVGGATMEDFREGSAGATSETNAQPLHKRPTRKRKPVPVPSSSPQGPIEASDSSAAGEPGSTSSEPAKSTARALSLPPASSSMPTVNVTMSANPNAIPLLAPIDGILRVGVPTGCTDESVRGYVEECSHPTVVAGLCAICGRTVDVKASDAQTGSGVEDGGRSRFFSNGEATMSRMTISGGVTVSVSQEEGQMIAQQDAQRLRKLRKLSLVLDLDHTLVHATWDVQAQQQAHHPDVRSLLLPVPVMEGDVRREIRMQHFVKLRPHLETFLSRCQDYYEFGVYTAGTRDYAEQVTLILARHLVGATRDEIDLEMLRQRIVEAELELNRKKLSTDARSDSSHEGINASDPDRSSGSENEIAVSSEDGTTKDTPENSEDEPKATRKRKRVAFGEPVAEQKSDEMTPQRLAELRRELEEAEAMEARAVEAKQRLFGSRVVSRTDVGDLGRDVKSLKRIFPCGGTMAAVVDDREDVWANAQDQVTSTNQQKRKGEPPDNLLLVRPYHWDTFVGFADVNNASGVDLSTASTDAESKRSATPKRGSSESDQQLLWTSDVLLRLHQRYYQHDEGSATKSSSRPSVPEILASMRREVLRGCNVVLSGLIPIHKQNATAESDRPRPPIVRYVEDLGGRIVPAVTGDVTHVVAAKDGTDKIVAARQVPGCIVVKTAWLMECVWSLTRRDELPHVLGPAPRPVASLSNGAPVRPLAESKRENSSASSEDDDDEEDDEFAAELEKEFM